MFSIMLMSKICASTINWHKNLCYTVLVEVTVLLEYIRLYMTVLLEYISLLVFKYLDKLFLLCCGSMLDAVSYLLCLISGSLVATVLLHAYCIYAVSYQIYVNYAHFSNLVTYIIMLYCKS